VKPRRSYSTDLSDEEWEILKPLVPEATPGGRPRAHEAASCLTRSFFYVVRGGCAQRLLPHDFPPWQTAYHYFRTWRIDGSWEKMHATLCGSEPAFGKVAEQLQARPSWSLGQPVGEDLRKRGVRGYDGAKKVNGRKRHLLVDTNGLVMKAKVHPVDLADREGARVLLERVGESFRVYFGTCGRGCRIPRRSRAKGVGHRAAGALSLEISLEIVQRKPRWVWVPNEVEPDPIPAGFEVIRGRWFVERTFAWICRNRRMSRDYEFLAQTTEALTYVTMIRMLLRRLAKGTA
jgi:putative transposase